jgi:hypothetical protein
MKTKIHPIEHNTIEITQNEKFFNSRLACGIRLKPWMNEIIISQVRQEELEDPEGELRIEGY